MHTPREGIDFPLRRPWKQGFVLTHDLLYRRLEIGRVWHYRQNRHDEQFLDLKTISTSPEGEVHLRPLDTARAKEMFPDEEYVKGAASVCPFKRVDSRMAAGSKGVYQEGDLLCHEAWDLWGRME